MHETYETNFPDQTNPESPMKIFLLSNQYNKFGESDWASIYEADEVDDHEELCVIDWATQSSEVELNSPVPLAVSIEMPKPAMCMLNQQLVVFDYKSAKIQRLFANSQVEWLPCKVTASYDEDTNDEIELSKEHAGLELAIANPLVRCRLAPAAMVGTVGNGFWNQLEAIDNMSLYEDELSKSDVFRIEGAPMVFSSVAFKKAAQELGVESLKFDRISTLTS